MASNVRYWPKADIVTRLLTLKIVKELVKYCRIAN